MKTFIPHFEGFYYSNLDSLIDHELESICEYLSESLGQDINTNELDYTINHAKIAEAWLNEYKDQVFFAHGVKLDSLKFDRLESPKYYNFETDKLLVTINKKDLLSLKRVLFPKNNGLQSVINKQFKSRSGFISFYDDFVSDWKTKAFSDWDEGEVSCLFPNVEIDYSNINEAIANAISYNTTK